MVNGHAGYTPTGICGLGAPCPAGTGPGSQRAVCEAALQSTTGPDSAGLTLATVASGAVTGEGGLANPPGSAAITGTSGLAFGAEQAPYITTASSCSSSGPRRSASSAIDVKLDVAAYPQAASTTTGVFNLVFAANVINSPTRRRSSPGTNNEEEECTGPSSSMSTVETAWTTPGVRPDQAPMAATVRPQPRQRRALMTSAQIGWIVMNRAPWA